VTSIGIPSTGLILSANTRSREWLSRVAGGLITYLIPAPAKVVNVYESDNAPMT